MNTGQFIKILLALWAIGTSIGPALAQEASLQPRVQPRAQPPARQPLTIEVKPGSEAGVDIELEGADIGSEVSITVKRGADCTIQTKANKVTISNCSAHSPPVDTPIVTEQTDTTGLEDDTTSIEYYEPRDEYRGGDFRLGVFAIEGLRSRALFGPENLPLAVTIDLEKDLGLRDSMTAFRSDFTYRFSKRHAISLGHYRLDRKGTIGLSETIRLGETDFDIGFDIVSRHEEKITKLAYNFIFHDDGKVLLSIAPGIHFSNFKFSIESIGSLTPLNVKEKESVAAPLPMLGGRIVYRFNPKWSVVAVSDVFFLDAGDQEGNLTDAHIFAEYRVSNRFTIGGGLNRFSLNLELVDRGIRWDVESIYTGAYLFVGFDF